MSRTINHNGRKVTATAFDGFYLVSCFDTGISAHGTTLKKALQLLSENINQKVLWTISGV